MVLLALKRPEVYDSIARGTRRRFESNRPRAILFEGPPGDCTLP
jgi:SpoVK/Ycf46/Vps4 family AAA+-type ATPase